MIPWQAPDSRDQGVLQERRRPPGWERSWGTPEGGWWRVNWLEGQGLEDFLQQWVAAVAGLDGPLVRPRWQRTPANIPDFDTPCWAAVGVTRYLPLGIYSWVQHEPSGRPLAGWDRGERWDRGARWNGASHDEMTRWEELSVECTFYGPDAAEVTGRFHSNLMVWQNTHLLRHVQMAFVDPGEHRRAPELIKEQWLDRYDKTLTLRRAVWRAYPVLHFTGFAGRVETDSRYHAPFRGQIPMPDWDSGAQWDAGRWDEGER